MYALRTAQHYDYCNIYCTAPKAISISMPWLTNMPVGYSAQTASHVQVQNISLCVCRNSAAPHRPLSPRCV